MILGNVCTRDCAFCAVRSGEQGEPVDPEEPARVAMAVREMGLEHAVITSPTRDDLQDSGAGQFSLTTRAIRGMGKARVELLIPDFQGRDTCLEEVLSAGPDVVGHNVEVVRSLQKRVRDPRASFDRSLKVLGRIKEVDAHVVTKSSLMLGLGESVDEVREAMGELAEAGVDILTLGQYLRPKNCALEVELYLHPREFERLREEGIRMGFREVLSGPLVRSSYRSSEAFSHVMGGVQDAR